MLPTSLRQWGRWLKADRNSSKRYLYTSQVPEAEATDLGVPGRVQVRGTAEPGKVRTQCEPGMRQSPDGDQRPSPRGLDKPEARGPSLTLGPPRKGGEEARETLDLLGIYPRDTQFNPEVTELCQSGKIFPSKKWKLLG